MGRLSSAPNEPRPGSWLQARPALQQRPVPPHRQPGSFDAGKHARGLPTSTPRPSIPAASSACHRKDQDGSAAAASPAGRERETACPRRQQAPERGRCGSAHIHLEIDQQVWKIPARTFKAPTNNEASCRPAASEAGEGLSGLKSSSRLQNLGISCRRKTIWRAWKASSQPRRNTSSCASPRSSIHALPHSLLLLHKRHEELAPPAARQTMHAFVVGQRRRALLYAWCVACRVARQKTVISPCRSWPGSSATHAGGLPLCRSERDRDRPLRLCALMWEIAEINRRNLVSSSCFVDPGR